MPRTRCIRVGAKDRGVLGSRTTRLEANRLRDTITAMRIGTVLIWVGLSLALLGLLIRYFPGLFSWFGNLPGDIDIHTENSRTFIPITSMIVVSVVATILINLVAAVMRNR